jgi:hypothetical protein
MKKILFFFFLIFFLRNSSFAQINWKDDTIPYSQIQWDNYSTSFAGENTSLGPILPMLVTAIPYNGIHTNFDDANAAMDMSFSGSAFRFQSNLSDNSRQLYTYDSSNVYFLAVGIYPENAKDYEYEILLNGKTIITSWKTIDKFTDFQLNDFKKGFGFLGGYKTTWNNFLVVELRKKSSTKIVSSAAVYWKQIKPVLLNIYTTNNFNDFFKRLKKSYDFSIDSSELKIWTDKYPPDQIDSINHLPKKLFLQPTENNLIFYIKAEIYKREALEYQLIKNGEIFSDWKANDFDNNFIWLKNLSYGNYELKIRYAKQRHNVTSYSFEIKPAWFQTRLFRFVSLFLVCTCVGFIIVLFLNLAQKKKITSELQRKEKINLQLKSIRSQLNPHFIFNSISSIQGLINKNEIDNANKYLNEFAGLMRSTLNGSDKENNNLVSEIKTLESYLQLEQLRFYFNYSVESLLNNSEIEIPSLLLQPIVENAVKHGVSALQEKGVINIFIEKKGNDMIINIIDNGKGFDANALTKGFGLKLTRERIALLNEMTKSQSIVLEIQSAERTTVHLTFKNWL